MSGRSTSRCLASESRVGFARTSQSPADLFAPHASPGLTSSWPTRPGLVLLAMDLEKLPLSADSTFAPVDPQDIHMNVRHLVTLASRKLLALIKTKPAATASLWHDDGCRHLRSHSPLSCRPH
jgi:hypothetical protein